MNQIRNKQIKFDSKISFQGGNKKIENLANGTAANDAVNYSQLQAIQSLINNFEWQPSALSYIVDNTIAPPTEVLGDRYILSHDGGAPNAAYDGASAGSIVEFDGTVWVETVPTLGTFISADAEPTKLYYWGGTSWSSKYFESTTASNGLNKVGFDIQLDVLSATFIEGAQDAVGGALTDTATIDFTYNDVSNTISAIVVLDSITEDHLKNLGTGLSGQVLTSDGAGGFTWVDLSTISPTERRKVATAAVTTGDAQLAATDIFGLDDPRNGTFPIVFINGQQVSVADDNTARTTSAVYFGTASGTATAINALTSSENLYVNGTVLGYDLDASDTITVHYTV